MRVETPYLVAIDPGLRLAGLAVFADGVLVHAELVQTRKAAKDEMDPLRLNAHVAAYLTRSVREHVRGSDPLTVVAEWPRVFGRGRSKGDPNDLLPLAGCSAACVARLQPQHALAVRPDEWKGTMPTEGVLESRVLARLGPALGVYDRARLNAKSLAHNVTDAVGIGLWALGELEPVRVIPR